jgi:hypothetical protein
VGAAEDVRRALLKIEGMPNAADRARAATDLLREWPDLHRLLKEIRQQSVIAMNEAGMDFPEIGVVLGVDRSRAWQISKGR